MSKIFTADMKRRATYETLVRDTILNPKDKINLPDREATLLRNTQQLSRYDDDDFLGLEKDNNQITKERIQQIEITKLVSDTHTKTITVEKAMQEQPKDPNQFQSSTSPGAPPPPSQPPPPFPPSNPKFFTGASSSGHLTFHQNPTLQEITPLLLQVAVLLLLQAAAPKKDKHRQRCNNSI